MPKKLYPTSSGQMVDTWGRANNRKLVDKACPYCNKIFRPSSRRSKYCSRKCAYSQNGKNQKTVSESWWINSRGYVVGWIKDDLGVKHSALKHRIVIEKSIGRALSPEEDVHHIDGNKLNNEISNLSIVGHGNHSTFHNLIRVHKKGYRLNLTREERLSRSDRMRKNRNKAESK